MLDLQDRGLAVPSCAHVRDYVEVWKGRVGRGEVPYGVSVVAQAGIEPATP